MKYYCPACREDHEETAAADFQRPILPDRCSAQYRNPPKPGGMWRVCHADFQVFGGPHQIGRANLCTPCWDRQMAPHIARGIHLAKDQPVIRRLLEQLGGKR